jgi:hypothetical protein
VAARDADTLELATGGRRQRGLVVLADQRGEALDRAQRRPQVVRDRVGERFEILVGRFEQRSSLANLGLEVEIESPDIVGRVL